MKKILHIMMCILCIACSHPKTSDVKVDHEDEDKKTGNIFVQNNIKGYKVIEYKYKFGEPDTVAGFTTKIVELNRNGDIIKLTEYHSSKYMKEYDAIRTYTYKNDTLAQSIVYNLTGKLKEKNIFEYDKNKRMTSSYNADGVLISKRIEELDDKGRAILNISYDKDGNVSNKHVTTYDELGMKESLWYSDGVLHQKEIRSNSDEKKIEYTIYNKDGEREYIITNIYDNKHQLIDYYYKSLNSDYEARQKTNYSNSGLKIEYIDYERNNEPETLSKFYYEEW